MDPDASPEEKGSCVSAEVASMGFANLTASAWPLPAFCMGLKYG